MPPLRYVALAVATVLLATAPARAQEGSPPAAPDTAPETPAAAPVVANAPAQPPIAPGAHVVPAHTVAAAPVAPALQSVPPGWYPPPPRGFAYALVPVTAITAAPEPPREPKRHHGFFMHAGLGANQGWLDGSAGSSTLTANGIGPMLTGAMGGSLH